MKKGALLQFKGYTHPKLHSFAACVCLLHQLPALEGEEEKKFKRLKTNKKAQLPSLHKMTRSLVGFVSGFRARNALWDQMLQIFHIRGQAVKTRGVSGRATCLVGVQAGLCWIQQPALPSGAFWDTGSRAWLSGSLQGPSDHRLKHQFPGLGSSGRYLRSLPEWGPGRVSSQTPAQVHLIFLALSCFFFRME